MEALGGMGYVEDTPLPMLYREAPLNAIWEGRAMSSASTSCGPWCANRWRARCCGRELEAAKGAHRLRRRPGGSAAAADRARHPQTPNAPATLLTAAELFRFAPAEIAEAYAACRLAPLGRLYGTAPRSAGRGDPRASWRLTGPGPAGLVAP